MKKNKIKCTKQKIEDGGATINLGANTRDSKGVIITDIVWEKGIKEKDKKDKINKDSNMDFDTVCYRGPYTKTIGQFICDTDSFIEI